MQLDFDIVAKALSRIGDPTLPAVYKAAKEQGFWHPGSGHIDPQKYGSPLARKALEHQRFLESNPENVEPIDESLRH
jgi:hypothetical protein